MVQYTNFLRALLLSQLEKKGIPFVSDLVKPNGDVMKAEEIESIYGLKVNGFLSF